MAATVQLERRVLPGLAVVVAGTLAARMVSSWTASLSALVAAVLVGVIIGNTSIVNTTTTPGLGFATKKLLRTGVVLLGLRLSLGQLTELGARTVLIVVATVAVTFFGTQALGRRLGVGRDLSLLVATGFSICGASAIAAVEDSTDADDEEVAMAIGLVTLFGSLAIVALPLLAAALGVTDPAFGMWVGASVHDVAQVVATASTGGQEVLAIAVIVKLTRVVLLAPIIAGINLTRQRETDAPVGGQPLMPRFVVGFLLMVLIRTVGVLPTAWIDVARAIEGLALTMALVGLGTGVRLDRLRRLGARPVVLGLVSWTLVASFSYLAITWFAPLG